MTSIQRALVVVLPALVAACPPPPAQEIPIPGALELEELPEEQRALLRATLEVADALLEETEVTLHVDRGTVSGDLTLQNVQAAGSHALTLRVYGRYGADAEEVLLGTVITSVDVAPGQPSYVGFPEGAQFESCAAGPDARCALIFDANRNGTSNILDLLPEGAGGRGIDPAPQPLAIDAAPSTLQFASGIGLGEFARQVIVLENLGENPVRVLSVDVIDAPGVALSQFSSAGVAAFAPRRSLSDADFPNPIAPTGEELLAISFAPRNPFLATGAVQVVVEDSRTGVRQAVRTKVIANADGDLSPADPTYLEPTLTSLTLQDGATVSARPFPREPLFSGLSITSDNGGAASGLARNGAGAVLVLDAPDGASRVAVPADAAFVADIPAGHRFSASLGGLTSDVDLAVVTLDDAGAITGLACAACVSSQAGSSAEAAEVENGGDVPLRVAVVLGRVEASEPIAAIPGGLAAAPERVPFELGCRVSRGPEFADADPVTPSRGPLEGGQTVTLRGRGFVAGATVTFAGFSCIDVNVVEQDENGDSTITCRVPPGSLEVGKNPATLVVQNPSIENGGDGQAATLPEGYTYDPPAPRVETVAPDFAPTTGGTAPVTIRGTFFSARFGPPVAYFGDLATETVVQDAETLVVNAPAVADVDTPSTVALRVRNRLGFDDPDGTMHLGAASNALSFRYLVPDGDAPTITSVSPSSGSVDGGTVVTIGGTRFLSEARVFFGASEATDVVITAPPATSLTCRAPAGSPGPSSVVVVNPDGQAGTLADGYAYTIPSPVITQVFPSRISSDGGAVLVVDGSGFRAGVTVQFEDGATAVPATGASRSSSDSLLAFAPPLAAGTWTLAVVNPDAQRATAVVDVFTPVGPPPTVESVSPDSGDIGGGAMVDIFGRNFTDTVTVVFHDVVFDDRAVSHGEAGGFDRVTVAAPPSSVGAGRVDLQVINTDGQAALDAFTYTAPTSPSPQIVRVDPASLVANTPSTVVITGYNFDAANAVVTLAGAPVAVDLELSSAAQLVGAAPGVVAGLATLEVRNPDGQSARVALVVASAAPPPTIAALTPSLYETDDGVTEVEITGGGFQSPTVRLNGTLAMIVGAPTTTSIIIDVRYLPAGSTLVEVENADGRKAAAVLTVLVPGAVVVPPPRLFTVQPPYLPANTELTMVLGGADFVDDPLDVLETEVLIDGEVVPADPLTTTSDIFVPSTFLEPGDHVVEVQNPDGQRDVLVVTAHAVGPRIIALAPEPFPADNPQQLTINGADFDDVAGSVFVDGVYYAANLGPGTITVDSLYLGTGAHLVEVLNGDGQSDGDILDVVASGGPVRPTIELLNPVVLVEDTGIQHVEVRGFNFDTPPLGVFVGGYPQAPTSSTSTSIGIDVDTATIDAGTLVVEVQNQDYQVAAASMMVQPPGTLMTPPPSLFAVSPATVATGTTFVQLQGIDFQPGATVTMNGYVVAVTNEAPPNTIDINPSGFVASVYAVRVTNPDGQSDVGVLEIFDAVLPPPRLQTVSPPQIMQGTPVVQLSGTGFHAGAWVTLNGTGVSITGAAPPSFLQINPSSFAVGVYTVRVHNPDGQSDVGVLDILPPQVIVPEIDTVNPPVVTADSGIVQVIVSGRNFTGSTDAYVGGSPAATTFVSATQLQVDVDTDALPVGPLVLEVVDGAQAAAITFELAPAPAAAGVAPHVVHATIGGDEVVITGTNLAFQPPTSVTIGVFSGTILVAGESALRVEVPIGLPPGVHPLTIHYGVRQVSVGDLIAISPTVTFAEVKPRGNGTMSVILVGDMLGGDDVASLDLLGVSSGAAASCNPEPRTETTLSCGAVPSGDLLPGESYDVTVNYFTSTFLTNIARVKVPALSVVGAQPENPSYPGAMPRGVAYDGQPLVKRQLRLDIPDVTASSFAGGTPNAVIGPTLTPVSANLVLNTGFVIVELASGALPLDGDVEITLRSDARQVTQPFAMPLFVPAVANLEPGGGVVEVPWSLNPNAVQVQLGGDLDTSLIAAVHDDNAMVQRALPASGIATLDASVAPLTPGEWSVCLRTPTDVAFGCAAETLLVRAPSLELEPNNTDANPNAIGITNGTNGTTQGTVSAGDRDRFVFTLPVDGLLYVATVRTAQPVTCGGSDSIELVVRERGRASLLAKTSVEAGNQCPGLGVGSQEPPLSLPAGEYVIEAQNVTEGNTNYRIHASVAPEPLATCGDGVVQNGEEATCENNGGSAPCPAPHTGTMVCDPVSCTFDRSACVPGGGTECQIDGIVNGTEQCDPDGVAFVTGSARCSSLIAYPSIFPGVDFNGVGGALRCTSGCLIDVTECMSGASCGNGMVEGFEECDDGNGLENDGCSSNCTLERCGNGVVNANETCDDGDTMGGNACPATCVGT